MIHWNKLVLIFSVICLLAVIPKWNNMASECEQCHKDPKYFVQDKVIFNYYQDWLKSPHKKAGIECDDCHGGNPETKDKTEAHVGVYHVTDPRSKIHISQQFETCGQCHKTENTQFSTSRHSERINKEKSGLVLSSHAPACTTCHLAMNRTPYYKNVVEQTCRFCHYENNDAGLPMVARETNEILHRLNVSKGYLSWTELYYKSRGWPSNSKHVVSELNSQYHNIVSNLHSFKMQTSEKESIDLMVRLRQVFDEVSAEEEKESIEAPNVNDK
jgi:hypothetical protein